MADGVGWRSFWWLNVALHSFTFLVLLIALPETKWDRVVVSSKPETGAGKSDLPEKSPAVATSSDGLGNLPPTAHDNGRGSESSQEFQDMHLGKGKPNRHQWQGFQISSHPFRTLLQAFYLPWKLLTFPIVVFASFIVSFSASCYLMITFVQSQALGAPPYNFSPQSVGFMNFASLVGALIGLLTAGRLSDWISAKLTERNRGIREPEMRLVTMIPYVLIMLLGNFIVGFGLQSGWDWRVRSTSPYPSVLSHPVRVLTMHRRPLLSSDSDARVSRLLHFQQLHPPTQWTPTSRRLALSLSS